MKKFRKILLIAAAVFVIAGTLSPAALANDTKEKEKEKADKVCHIEENLDRARIGDNIYERVEIGDIVCISDLLWDDQTSRLADIEYDSAADRREYGGSLSIDITTGDYDYILTCYPAKQDPFLFVRSDMVGSVKNLLAGEPESYSAVSEYGEVISITKGELESWKSTAPADMPANELLAFDTSVVFYGVDSGGGIGLEAGEIFRSGEEYRMIIYGEYDRSDFYYDGSFAFEKDVTAHVYTLNDSDVARRLSAGLDARPDDSLDWIVNDGENMGQTRLFVTTVVCFGILPVALIVFCCVRLRKRPARHYRIGFTALGVLSAVILVCFTVALIILT